MALSKPSRIRVGEAWSLQSCEYLIVITCCARAYEIAQLNTIIGAFAICNVQTSLASVYIACTYLAKVEVFFIETVRPMSPNWSHRNRPDKR